MRSSFRGYWVTATAFVFLSYTSTFLQPDAYAESLNSCLREAKTAAKSFDEWRKLIKERCAQLAIPGPGPMHDWCSSVGANCACGNTGWPGICSAGPHKSGIYCRCDYVFAP